MWFCSKQICELQLLNIFTFLKSVVARPYYRGGGGWLVLYVAFLNVPYVAQMYKEICLIFINVPYFEPVIIFHNNYYEQIVVEYSSSVCRLMNSR